MPRTRKRTPTDVPEDVLDHFAGPARPMSAADVETVMRRFKKALVERMLGGELTHHPGYPPGGAEPDDTTNHRNGTSGKTVLTDEGPLVHRASAPSQLGLRDLEGAEGAGRSPARDLHRPRCRSRRRGPGHVCRRPLGPALSGDCRERAPRLGPRHPLLRVSAGGAEGGLHDQRPRECPCAASQDRGRTERAHRDLENRTERGFPQRPHASSPHTRNSGHSPKITLCSL